jgi:mRNA interferase MazF
MRKTRPVVVVGDDRIGKLGLSIVVPITDWKEHYARAPWMVRLDPAVENGLTKPSAGDAFQVRSISHERLLTRLGVVSADLVDALAVAIALCVGYRAG